LKQPKNKSTLENLLEISTLKRFTGYRFGKNRTLITRPINYYMTGIKFIKTELILTVKEAVSI
jgi:hypothetical protein